MNSSQAPNKSRLDKVNIQPLMKQYVEHEKTIQDESLRDNIPPSSYKQLFYFADKTDWILMAFAFLFSFGNGISIVFYSIPLKQLINAFSTTQDKDQIVSATVSSVYGFLINSAIVFVNCWLMTAAWTITSQRQMSRARKQYFSALLRQELSWHDKTRPAQICSQMYVRISKVQQAMVTNMTSVLTKISMGISGIIVALAIGYRMAFVMILFLPIMLLSGVIRGYFLKQKQMYIQTKKVKLDSDVIQVFDNIKTVKMLAGQVHQINRYQKSLKIQRQINWSHGWKGAIAFTFFFFCIIINYALGFWYGAKLVADRTTNGNTGQPYNVAQVVTIFFTLYISNMNLSGLPDSIASFSVSRYSMAKILAIVKRVPKIKDGELNFPNTVKKIIFKDVEFMYDKPLFQHLNLNIQKGITALIGQSGCGKSTIVSLIMRFYDVLKGQILLAEDNKLVNINTIKNDSLKKNIGYVGQQPILIGKSVKQILMAQNYSQPQIYSLLQVAKADEFVKQIGLDTQLKSVSGGQKQRLAIVRALLKKPKILILDQSTSALDQKTQQQVLTNISKMGISFVIMVAHRQQTLAYADRIIKISKDNIQFNGTYKQLLQKGLIKKVSAQFVQKKTFTKKQKLTKDDHQLKQNHQGTSKVVQQHEIKNLNQQKHIEDQKKHETLPFKCSYIGRLMQLNKDKTYLYILGIIGAIYFGCIFPSFSYLISRIILILQNIAIADSNTYQDQAHKLTIILFMVSFGSLIFTTLRWVCFQYLNEQIGYKVKLRAFGQLVSRPYSVIQNEGGQSYAYMINKNCEDLKPLAGNFMPSIIENAITLVVGLFIAFFFCWQITVISLVILPLILLSSKMMMSFNHGMQSITDQTHKRIHELVITAITNLKTVRSCLLQKALQQKYANELDQALQYSIKYGNLAGILFGVGQTLISCTLAAIFFAGACLIKADLSTVQNIYTAMFAVMFAGVQAGGNLYFLGQMSAAKIGACVYEQHIIQHGQVQKQPIVQDKTNFHIFQGNNGVLKINNVTFQYPNRNTPVLENFSLQVKKNQKIALVGQSGSGKSTVTSLLFRLYEPQIGTITIDGHPLNQMSMSKVSKVMGIVMQEPALFNRSVYQNLKYNWNSATAKDIASACKSAKAYDFIQQGNFGINHESQNPEQQNLDKIEQAATLPQGFSKSVGPKGSFLSGGQKQRVSIARALARKPKILILDQATSALDTQNEKAIQETLQAVSGVTQIIIAHRLSTIVNCDRIVVLQHGKIIQSGTYKQLVQKGGYFYQLTQSKKENK